jgi:hypothetical protein
MWQIYMHLTRASNFFTVLSSSGDPDYSFVNSKLVLVVERIVLNKKVWVILHADL